MHCKQAKREEKKQTKMVNKNTLQSVVNLEMARRETERRWCTFIANEGNQSKHPGRARKNTSRMLENAEDSLAVAVTIAIPAVLRRCRL